MRGAKPWPRVFLTFFACSNNRGLFRDIDYARQVIGYEPQDGVR